MVFKKNIKKGAVMVMSKPLKIVLIIAALIIGGYGAYRLYIFIIDDATKRITRGTIKNIGSAINPLNLPKTIFGK